MTPPIVEEVKNQLKGQQALDSSTDKKKSSSGPNEQQERLTDRILSEGLEKVDRRPLGKQAEIKSGTPTEVCNRYEPGNTVSCSSNSVMACHADCNAAEQQPIGQKGPQKPAWHSYSGDGCV